jgi:Flp pilus assembly protein TadD
MQAYMRQAPMSALPVRLAVCLMTCRGQLDVAADAAEQAARLAPHDASVLMQLGVSAARVRRCGCFDLQNVIGNV